MSMLLASPISSAAVRPYSPFGGGRSTLHSLWLVFLLLVVGCGPAVGLAVAHAGTTGILLALAFGALMALGALFWIFSPPDKDSDYDV
jgi:hypothetical protein